MPICTSFILACATTARILEFWMKICVGEVLEHMEEVSKQLFCTRRCSSFSVLFAIIMGK